MKKTIFVFAMLARAVSAGAESALEQLQGAARAAHLPAVAAVAGKPSGGAGRQFLWEDGQKSFLAGYKPSAVVLRGAWKLTAEIVKGAGAGRYDKDGLREGSAARRMRVGGLDNPFVPQILKVKTSGLGLWLDRNCVFDIRMPDDSWLTSPDHKIRAAQCRMVTFDRMLCLVAVDPATGGSVDEDGRRLWGFSREL